MLGVSTEGAGMPASQLPIDESLERLNANHDRLVSTPVLDPYGLMALGSWALALQFDKRVLEKIAGQTLTHETTVYLGGAES